MEFLVITRQAVRRGTFTSVKNLISAIENFIDGWNTRCTPFVWTKTADDILTKAHRKTTSITRHQDFTGHMRETLHVLLPGRVAVADRIRASSPMVAFAICPGRYCRAVIEKWAPDRRAAVTTACAWNAESPRVPMKNAVPPGPLFSACVQLATKRATGRRS